MNAIYPEGRKLMCEVEQCMGEATMEYTSSVLDQDGDYEVFCTLRCSDHPVKDPEYSGEEI